MKKEYQPKTGQRCSCKPGVYRDNCPSCEGTGWVINFAAIRYQTARTIDWLAFRMKTGLDLEEMDIIAKQAGINMNAAFITQEQADKFNQSCLDAGLGKYAAFKVGR